MLVKTLGKYRLKMCITVVSAMGSALFENENARDLFIFKIIQDLLDAWVLTAFHSSP